MNIHQDINEAIDFAYNRTINDIATLAQVLARAQDKIFELENEIKRLKKNPRRLIKRLRKATKELLECNDITAEEWLHSPAKAFDGKTPYEVSLERKGENRVKNLLQQIAHGVII